MSCEECYRSELRFKNAPRCLSHFFNEIRGDLEKFVDFISCCSHQNLANLKPDFFKEYSLELLYLSSYIDSLLISNDNSLDQLSFRLYKFALKILEMNSLGINIVLSRCTTCKTVQVNYQVFKVCSCDEYFKEDLRKFNQDYRHRKKLLPEIVENKNPSNSGNENIKKAATKIIKKELKNPPFKIWDKIENMLQRYTGSKNSYIEELVVLYDNKIHSNIWADYEKYTEFILSDREVKSKQIKKNLKYDGQGRCFFVLAEGKNANNGQFELSSGSQLIVLYQIVIGR